MAFIKKDNKKIGDSAITKIEHSSMSGTFTKGSRVKIIDINPVRGYTIEDKHGNKIREIGWVI